MSKIHHAGSFYSQKPLGIVLVMCEDDRGVWITLTCYILRTISVTLYRINHNPELNALLFQEIILGLKKGKLVRIIERLK